MSFKFTNFIWKYFVNWKYLIEKELIFYRLIVFYHNFFQVRLKFTIFKLKFVLKEK